MKHALLALLFLAAIAGCATPETAEIAAKQANRFTITYEGEWQGNLHDQDGGRTINGNGPTEYAVRGTIVIGTIGKADDSDRPLTIRLLDDDEVLKEQTTTSPYGAVSVSV